MSEHDVLKKNRNFYIGVGGTVLEGLLSGSLFMLLYSVMQFLWSGQFDMNRVLVLTCVIAVVFLLRILIYSYGYTKAQIGGAEVSKNTRLFMGDHLKRIPLSRFTQGQTGDYINTITSDVNNYEKILTHKSGVSEPPMTLILTVRENGENGEVKTITAENISLSFVSEDEKGQQFLSVCEEICKRLITTDEWKALPAYEKLYE